MVLRSSREFRHIKSPDLVVVNSKFLYQGFEISLSGTWFPQWLEGCDWGILPTHFQLEVPGGTNRPMKFGFSTIGRPNGMEVERFSREDKYSHTVDFFKHDGSVIVRVQRSDCGKTYTVATVSLMSSPCTDWRAFCSCLIFPACSLHISEMGFKTVAEECCRIRQSLFIWLKLVAGRIFIWVT